MYYDLNSKCVLRTYFSNYCEAKCYHSAGILSNYILLFFTLSQETDKIILNSGTMMHSHHALSVFFWHGIGIHLSINTIFVLYLWLNY